MELGVFSLSLSVKDIVLSKSFYEKLGFSKIGGDISQNWLILQNGETTIGLFQRMFEKNTLTFNPGWNSKVEKLKEFKDIRQIQQNLKEKDITFQSKADGNSTGPASFLITDPDGNPILFDQHV